MSEFFPQPDWSSAPQLTLPPVGEGSPRSPTPRPLGFFEALGWCVLFLLFTQGLGGCAIVACVVAIVLFAPWMIPPGSLTDVGAVMNSQGMSLALMEGLAVTEMLVIGFSLLVLHFLVGPDWQRRISIRRPAGRHVLLVLASFPAVWLLGNVVYACLQSSLPSFKDMVKGGGVEELMEVFVRWPWPVAVLIIGVGPGIGEELWCRGFLGQGLVRRYGVVLGVFFTSFFFGLIHVDPCQGTMAMLMGLWLHYVYLTTRTIFIPMLLHFLNNALSVLAPRWELLQTLDTKIGGLAPSVVVAALAGVVLLLLVGWALYRSRARLEDQSGILTDWPVGESPPAESGQKVVSAPLTLVPWLGVCAGLILFCSILGWVLRGTP